MSAADIEMLERLRHVAKPNRSSDATRTPDLGPQPVDWVAFWRRETAAGEFLLDPLIPTGRAVALYALAKGGKSLLMLECGAGLASGRSVLGQPARDPVSVLYLDMEMTEDDLRDRLEDLGYGPTDDLSNLHYFLLPSLPPLDTASGGAVLMALCERHQPDLVVIDTTGRVVAGPENDADTYRAFYRHTGARLKAAGIAQVRLDHAGKDADRGQRGSSSKTEDVDLVWHLTAEGSALRLRATHKRLSWVPDELRLTRVLEPFVRHGVVPRTWPAGTADCAALLDQLDVPLDASSRTAGAALRNAGEGRRREVVWPRSGTERTARECRELPREWFPEPPSGTERPEPPRNHYGTAGGTARNHRSEYVDRVESILSVAASGCRSRTSSRPRSQRPPGMHQSPSLNPNAQDELHFPVRGGTTKTTPRNAGAHGAPNPIPPLARKFTR